MVAPYCLPADIRNALGGTDAGTGTAAQLSDAQLVQATVRGSDMVSAYAGTVYDSADLTIPVPPLVSDLALSLACYYATLTYLKGKPLGADDPVRLAYMDAMKVLNDVRDGKVRLDPQTGGAVLESGRVINRIPGVFSDDDSNTFYDPFTGRREVAGENQSLISGLGPDFA
jgi:phage gp36-like protein